MRRKLIEPAALLGATALALVGAEQLSDYSLDLGVTIMAYLTIAAAWNILGGYGGQISLGSAAFVGTGGYTTGLLLLHTGLSWPLTLIAAGINGGLLAVALSVALLRLRGDYFAVGSLAAAIALQAFVLNWAWAGGATGIILPVDVPLGIDLFRLAVVVTALALASGLYVARSRFGLRLTAVRDNEPAASGLGVSVYRHRLGALVLSSVLTALAGAIIAYQSSALSPDGMFGLTWSLNALLMTIVGGAGTFAGPIIGVVLVYYGLTKQFESTQTLSTVIEGALILVVVRFAPGGIWPLVAGLTSHAATRRRSSATRSAASLPASETAAPGGSDADELPVV
jgi:branched-chain amino acid transport system permease protein